MTSMMILTSLAGCIGNSDSDDDDKKYGTIMTSTYHVEQLVSAVVGDTASVETMSTANIPVHDYNPSVIDIERLKGSTAFFYHGLELEPWVDGILASEGIPPSYMTHTMPTGETTLDYQTMLVDALCEQLVSGDKESNNLSSYEDQAGQLEIHLEKGVQTLTFPPVDTERMEHMHDEGNETNNSSGNETNNHDHDDGNHTEHEHAKAEMVIENPANCPANTVISVFHLEKGKHVVEFETNVSSRTVFDIAALPMMGGHAHHDHHGHGDGSFEWAGIFAMNDATHTWSMQKIGGAYAESTMRVVLIPTTTPDEATMENLEGGVEELIEGNCAVVEDGETMQNIADTGTCFELHVGTGDDSTFNIDTTGLSGLAIYAQHVPTEFERDQHYLKDSTGADIEPVAQEGGGGDHGHHSGGGSGEANGTNNTSGNATDNDEDHEDPVCHDSTSHNETEQTDRASCEAAGNIWIIGEPNDGTRGYLTIHVENEGDYGFAIPSDVSVFLLESEDHDDHEGHSSHKDKVHDDHDDDDSTITADEDEDSFEYDPHSWLDPIAFKAQTQLVLDALIEVFPDGADTFTANAEVFMAELDKVHLGYVGAFGPNGSCPNKTVAANHNAYSYITERYGVEFVTVHGLDPEGQPSVEDVENVISKIKEDDISVMFIEEYTQASSVDLIVDETNVEVMYLYTMERAPSDAKDNYLSMLNKNLDNLKIGLGCAV